MTVHANPYCCPGFANNGYEIARDCYGCALYRSPGADKQAIWRSPPRQMPCEARVPKDREEGRNP